MCVCGVFQQYDMHTVHHYFTITESLLMHYFICQSSPLLVDWQESFDITATTITITMHKAIHGLPTITKLEGVIFFKIGFFYEIHIRLNQ